MTVPDEITLRLNAKLLVWILVMTAALWLAIYLVDILLPLAVAVLPLAMVPRILNPPQPPISGEDLRLANNATRTAEFTYRITGVWVQRLAFEDIRYGSSEAPLPDVPGQRPGTQVCLRGYTHFYIPWRRYRISLDEIGVNS